MPSAIEQIIKWAQSLPAWQADAVRRLLEQGELTAADRAELYEMLKVSAGIQTGGLAPEFPKLGGFSGAGEGQEPLILQRILNIQHVNAIKNGSTIPFALSGMTVVYGQNGSGKSSYARILKRACRARDTKDPIHPNVFDPLEIGPAAATIRITEGNNADVELPWVDGQEADPRLANVSFFDSKCARVIVDENNEAVYVPYGCEVFDNLVELLKSFRARLQSDKPVPAEPSSDGVLPGTESHTFLRQLSRNSRAEEISAATKWTVADEDSLTTLTARIAQSKTKESLERARRLRLTARQAGELIIAFRNASNALSAERVAAINARMDDVLAAETAVGLAAQTSLKSECLPSGGSSEWRLLYQAAREYSTKVAYAGKDFPVTAADSVCVLCQQPLSEEARSRLERFRQFMEDRSSETLRDAKQLLASSAQTIRGLQVPQPEHYGGVLEEVPEESRQRVVDTLLLLVRAQSDVLAAITAGLKVPLPAKLPDVTVNLSQLRTALENAAAQAEADADASGLRKLELSRDELASRKSLNLISSSMLAYVRDKQLEFLHEQCINSLGTRSISEKSKEIISEALSPQLQRDLARELETLGASHLPLNVAITGREGGARHRLALVNSWTRAKLSEVLSEGEQCVVAIAGFLAELGGAPVMSPIVFDDPITSLDHRYSRYVAERLAEEAKRRQVIVFTHNIAFLVEIEKHCAGVGLLVQTVQRTGSVPGRCMEGLPWEAMSVKERLNYIEQELNGLASLHGVDDDKYNSEAAHLYGLLRQTWEAFVERDLLNLTVQRHDTDVQTNRLMQVEVLDEDCVRIQNGMSKCSTWMTGHDKSLTLDVNRPAPSELREDIKALREFCSLINRRHEVVRKRRKAVLEPQKPALG